MQPLQRKSKTNQECQECEADHRGPGYNKTRPGHICIEIIIRLFAL